MPGATPGVLKPISKPLGRERYMRKAMWLLAASVVLGPVVSQATITFKVEDKTIVPQSVVTNDYVDVFVIADGADVGRAFDGFLVTANLTDGAGKLNFTAPFVKTTDDVTAPPLIQVPRTQYMKSGP